MKRARGKSHCPVNYTLEILGDQWSMLLLRDMLLFGKRRYKDFLGSEEKIATNILADRLALLEEQKIIKKEADEYVPTDKGYELLPILTEIALWGVRYDKDTAAPKHFIEWAKKDPKQFRVAIRKQASQKNIDK